MTRTSTEIERLSALLGEFSERSILVVGDLMLDEFVWGKVSRISPEAPVPIVNVSGESYYPGGAANAARNVRAFGACTALIGAAGNDPPGDRLIALLKESGIETGGIQCSASHQTAVKTRIIARNQQVVRVDRERRTRLSPAEKSQVIQELERVIDSADAIAIADYNKGFLDQEIADYICSVAKARGKVLTVDPHPHASLHWKCATLIKPNRTEVFLAAGMPVSEPVDSPLHDHALLQAAQRVRETWDAASLLVTLGEQGMLLFESSGDGFHIPAQAREVFDVSGAGDTAIAVLTLALAARATPYESAVLANIASSIAVGKLGTSTVTASEIETALSR